LTPTHFGSLANELEGAVTSAIAESRRHFQQTKGLVMKAAQAKLAGKRIDGKALCDLVKTKLPA